MKHTSSYLIIIGVALIFSALFFVWKEGVVNEVLIPTHPLIHVDSPQPGDIIRSPLGIMGEARGTWYFEASFPVELLDANGVQLAQHYASAKDEWMTEEFVPFSAMLEFEIPETNTGTLIMHKDNPSGLPEHDDRISIPIYFR